MTLERGLRRGLPRLGHASIEFLAHVVVPRLRFSDRRMYRDQLT